MKYAILADIHANLEALNAVVHDMQHQGCTNAVCLGDIVGYCANPKECLDVIRGMNIPVVKGNHDDYCSRPEPIEGFHPHALRVVEWTKTQLTEADQVWLRELSYVEKVEGFTIVHATLENPHCWGYVFDKLAAAASFARQETQVCFFGHTHVPFAFVCDRTVHGCSYSKFWIEPHKQYFINVGSVGQPRDGNPKAAYVTYELESGIVELRRVDYDIPGAQGKVQALLTPQGRR